jgi:phosphoglycolate phosphatase
MSRPKGLLFDKDGTLIDFHATWDPLMRRVALRLAAGDAGLATELMRSGGQDPESGRIAGGTVLAQGNTREIVSLWAPLLPHWKEDALTRELDNVFALEGVEGSVPVTELGPFFGRLKQRGHRLGVATSDNERAARAILAHLGALDTLDFLCGYDSGHGVKPEAGMVLGFCRTTGLAPHEVAVIGDNAHDLAMARAAGCGWAIGVLTGTSERERLAPLADLVLPSIVALEDWLLQSVPA